MTMKRPKVVKTMGVDYVQEKEQHPGITIIHNFRVMH